MPALSVRDEARPCITKMSLISCDDGSERLVPIEFFFTPYFFVDLRGRV